MIVIEDIIGYAVLFQIKILYSTVSNHISSVSNLCRLYDMRKIEYTIEMMLRQKYQQRLF